MNIALSCYLSPSGLSRAGQEYFKMLTGMNLGVVPNWLMPPQVNSVGADVAKAMLAAAKRQVEPGSVQFHVGLPQAAKLLKGRSCLIGSVVVEGNVLSADQAAGCRQMDIVAVPSNFCWSTCMASGISKSKIRLLPYPLDCDRWNVGVEPLLPRTDRFRFLFMNTWYERKGYDVLLRAWWEEFSANDKVELVIKSYNEDSRVLGVRRTLKKMSGGVDLSGRAPISILDSVLPDEALPGFMRSFDCYVSPHRAEGFGMNAWYAMALGVPVVCTDYGGTTDFAKDDTSWLIDAGRSRPSKAEVDLFPQFSNITWAEPSVASLRRMLRECYEDKALREERASRGAELVKEKYAPDRIGRMFENMIEKTFPEAWEQIVIPRRASELLSSGGDVFSSPHDPIQMIEL